MTVDIDAPAWLTDSHPHEPLQADFREVIAGQPAVHPIPLDIEPLTADETTPKAPTRVRLTFILTGRTPPHATRHFELAPSPSRSPGPWAFLEEPAGTLRLRNRDKPVFHYNIKPTHNPAYPEIQDRGAYIHPAFTPAGHIITGDYSKAHTHHRGFFLAYAKTHVGQSKIHDGHPDPERNERIFRDFSEPPRASLETALP